MIVSPPRIRQVICTPLANWQNASTFHDNIRILTTALLAEADVVNTNVPVYRACGGRLNDQLEGGATGYRHLYGKMNKSNMIVYICRKQNYHL